MSIELENFDERTKMIDRLCQFLKVKKSNNEMEEYHLSIITGMFHNYCVDYYPEATLRFFDAVKNHNKGVYKKNFPIFDESLIQYYCFKGEFDKAFSAFQNMRSKPTKNFLHYSYCIFLFCVYGYGNFVDRVLNPTVISSVTKYGHNIIADYLLTMKMFMFYEKCHKETPDYFPIKRLEKFEKVFKTESDPELLLMATSVLFDVIDVEESLEDLFALNGSSCLQVVFIKYMHEKGMEFVQGLLISNHFLRYLDNIWEDRKAKNDKNKRHDFFDFEYSDWIRVMQSFGFDGVFEIGHSDICAAWGIVYLYDCLYEKNFITKRQYKKFNDIIGDIKCYLMALYFPSLWKFDFVHAWPKPESVSEEDFSAEKRLFEISFTEKYPEDAGEKNQDLELLRKVAIVNLEEELTDVYDEMQFKRINELGEYDVEDLDVFISSIFNNINNDEDGLTI